MSATPEFVYTTPTLDPMTFARMSIATDDPNPVHVDHHAAVAGGLPSVVGSGLFVLGLLDKAARSTRGAEASYDYEIQLRAPIFPGRSLQVRLVAGEESSAVVIEDSEGSVVAQGTVS